MKLINLVLCLCLSTILFSQNLLQIPPALTGTIFNLNVQPGSIEYYPGFNTPTYGINGPMLAPTVIVNKGDVVTLNVHNTLNVNTTMHWHGLHLPAEDDGGPHDIITPGGTWSPSFEIMNHASTFWYHPHGHGKTELHVAKGIAGFFIIHDPEELALNIPHEYGVDDIPIVVQAKSMDVLKQFAIADHMDTALFVNGTLDTYAEFPAQVVRLRLLNGSSSRTFNFGFSNQMNFYQIGTDGGLKSAPLQLNRILLSPGERTEILVDFSAMQNQSVDLMSYTTEIPLGIMGSTEVGDVNNEIHDYEMNHLNVNDFVVMGINVIAPTSNAIHSIPLTLVNYTPFTNDNIDVYRELVLDTIRLLPMDVPNRAEGPFGINNRTFHMDSIDIKIPLNSKEIWTIKNNTLVAHPIHIHDIQFNVIEKSGGEPEEFEKGWKDVVLVMPGDSVKVLTKFEDFSDETHKYMYHCHLLHHEDDGMMGAFIVFDPNASINETENEKFTIYPNPANNYWTISNYENKNLNIELIDNQGKVIDRFNENKNEIKIGSSILKEGVYFLKLSSDKEVKTIKLIKE